MPPKRTAHRPSQAGMKYVRNRNGDKVLNTAYSGGKRREARHAVSLTPKTGRRVTRNFDIGDNAMVIATALRDKGMTPMLVGGFVRDNFLGRESKDVDIEVFGAADIDEVHSALNGVCRVDEVGKQFGVLKATLNGETIDVSVPRRESNVGAGHRDIVVEHEAGLSFSDAARRRDFTINALMADPFTGEVVDNFGGLDDLAAKRLKMVDPEKFGEDPLRVFRAVRFSGQFDFDMDRELEATVKKTDTSALPQERIWGEMEKVFSSPHPGKALGYLESTGLRHRHGCSRVPNPVPASVPAYVSVMGNVAGGKVPGGIRSEARKAGAVADVAHLSRAEVLDVMVDQHVSARLVNEVLTLRGSSSRLPNDLAPAPAILNGHDVMNAGFSGPEIKRILTNHRKAINRGIIDDKRSAEKWLKEQS